MGFNNEFLILLLFIRIILSAFGKFIVVLVFVAQFFIVVYNLSFFFNKLIKRETRNKARRIWQSQNKQKLKYAENLEDFYGALKVVDC